MQLVMKLGFICETSGGQLVVILPIHNLLVLYPGVIGLRDKHGHRQSNSRYGHNLNVMYIHLTREGMIQKNSPQPLSCQANESLVRMFSRLVVSWQSLLTN